MTAKTLEPYLQTSDQGQRLDLYVKGVKCGHCVHKITQEIEGLPQLQNFEFANGGQKLSLWSQGTSIFPDVMGKITGLGFEPIPVKASQEVEVSGRVFKSDLKKLAVAGVCAGNIMLFSTAVYLGADAEFRTFFHKLSFFLVLPPLFYSASSIWRGMVQSLRSFRFNLDLPIGIALSVGMGLSVTSLLGNQTQIYFDSIAVVIFLILSSRLLLNRYVANIQTGHWVQMIPGAWQARVVTDRGEEMKSLDQVGVGEQVRVNRGEVVPVDGRLLSDTGVFDEAVISGESSPVIHKAQDKVFAGSRLCMDSVLIESLQIGIDTRVGRSIVQAQNQEKENSEESFRWVGHFTTFVLLASVVTFASVWSLMGLDEAFQRAFAIVLVACPCAISFGIPLIRSFSGQLALQNGLIVKRPHVLKEIAKIKDLFFDKTGTLTQDKMTPRLEDLQKFSPRDLQKIFSLELAMDHPISNGFRSVKPKELEVLPVSNFKYEPGLGIGGEVGGEQWRIQTHPGRKDKSLFIEKNGQELGFVRLQTRLKDNLKPFFQSMVEKGYRISILSGDKESEVMRLQQEIPPEGRGQFLWQATPEQKRAAIQACPSGSLMVGDGINDLEAMGAAHLSLCMPGALENNLNVADGVLTRGDLQSVTHVFALAKKILRTERRLLFFTFSYNVLCVGLAAAGLITPVVAAILMPLSSITVLTLVSLNLRRL